MLGSHEAPCEANEYAIKEALAGRMSELKQMRELIATLDMTEMGIIPRDASQFHTATVGIVGVSSAPKSGFEILPLCQNIIFVFSTSRLRLGPSEIGEPEQWEGHLHVHEADSDRRWE
ncbi:unnamed protein product [Protopolystoma xenopodis]|uniref:Uncharacterized protein n=1 Tax=Protopolystoma xenopodis TaxID=117903 RepID=A0A3S5B291_9PLAT|nr:unnamed protein product [Protopolystoma xenopodis]